jgi:signal transduction histidine kinase
MMRKHPMSSLRVKLTVALLVTALAGIIIVAVLVQQYTTSEFDTFIFEQSKANFIADMTAYYEVVGSWENMKLAQGRFPMPPPAREPFPEDGPGAPGPEFPVRFVLADQNGEIVFPDPNSSPDQSPTTVDLEHADPIIVDGETVGYVTTVDNRDGRGGRDEFEEQFLDRINQVLVMATVGAIALALVLSFLFARSLSNPLREIASAIQSISHGQLDQRVPVRSRDEVGQVATAFNQMSADLARANQLRKQMTADIAHELRTPLSVIGGYLASLSDGLLTPSPERFKIMHDEAQHLQRLVEDLRTLSLADAGELPLNRRHVAPGELIRLAAATFSHQAEQREITLSIQAEPDLRLLYVDPDRILQILSNLLSNALRHTPQQGQITLSSRVEHDRIQLSIQDTGPGIPRDHLPHIFQRFYRVDSSRHQAQDESGLGLAIAKSITEVHGGTISVHSEVGTGTTFTLTFPASTDPGQSLPPDE